MNTSRTTRSVPADQSMALHSERLVYIKHAVVDGKAVYAIHAADGTPIGWAPDRDTAFTALRQQDFEPVSVH